MAFYEILIRGKEDGSISGVHAVDFEPDGTTADGSPRYKVGSPRPLVADDLSTLVGELFAGLAEQVAALKAENETLKTQEPGHVTPEPASLSISDRQFAHQLRNMGVITQAEALAFVARGELPAQLAAIVSAMEPTARDDAELLLSGAVVFHRNHPFTEAIGTAFGWTSEQIDEFFSEAVKV